MIPVTVHDTAGLPVPGSHITIPGSQPRFVARHWGKLAVALSILVIVIVVRLLPVTVERQVVAPGTVVWDVLGTGTLDARTRATVGAKIAGRMAEILADQGDQVKKNQVLARIDDADLRRQASAAEAAWRASQSSVVRAKADQARAQAVVEQAQRDRKRLEPLRESNIVSVESLEQAGERLAVAMADINRSAAAITEAEQQGSAAEETLRMYQARLAEATIVAPFDGVVVRRFREVGDVVVPGTALILVVATDTLWISAWVDESSMTGIAVGQQARIFFRSNPGKEHVGEVLRVGREVDRESRELLVDVRIVDPPIQWAIGQRAEVFIQTISREAACSIPARFLRTRGGVQGVWIDDHGAVAWRPLVIGLRGRNWVEVTKGLAAGEIMVIPAGDPLPTLREGQRISAR